MRQKQDLQDKLEELRIRLLTVREIQPVGPEYYLLALKTEGQTLRLRVVRARLGLPALESRGEFIETGGRFLPRGGSQGTGGLYAHTRELKFRILIPMAPLECSSEDDDEAKEMLVI